MRHDNEDDEAFAAAMVACHGYAPDCSYHGECLQGGDCFLPEPGWRAVRRIREFARAEEHDGVRKAMERAAVLLSAELKGEAAA